MLLMFIRFKKAALVCCMLLLCLGAQAQYNRPENNVWVFGINMGVNFNNDPPTLINTPFIQNNSYFQESGASVCNAQGQILFCTDGARVWDKNGALMPNGDILTQFLSSNEMTLSVAQNSLIVPVPLHSNKYYVFSATRDGFLYSTPGHLYYSVLDMNLNNGLGDIVAGQKGILLSGAQPVGERLTAIAGINCDIWVIATHLTGNKFAAYKVSDTGINTTPVLSVSAVPFVVLGCLAASPSGEKLALSSAPGSAEPKKGLSLFDFDPGTGIVSNGAYLDSLHNYYGICFSPDNSKLYASIWFEENGKVFQYDLNAADPSASQTLITQSAVQGSLGIFTGGLKLAGNGKLYINKSSVTLGRINNPDLAGVACNFTDSILLLPNGTSMNFSNTVVFPQIKDPTYTVKDSLICSGWQTGITLQAGSTGPGYTYLWNNGSTNAGITVTTPGTYWVRYHEACNFFVDTFHLQGSDIFTTIVANGFLLSVTGGPFASYQWYLDGAPIAGATSATWNVSANGDYTVAISNNAGCSFVSSAYTVTSWTGTGISDPLALAARTHVYPNPARDILYICNPVKVQVTLTGLEGRQILTAGSTGQLSLRQVASGSYLLRISDDKGHLIKVEKIVKQ